MKDAHVREFMIPLDQYPTVHMDDTLAHAVAALPAR